MKLAISRSRLDSASANRPAAYEHMSYIAPRGGTACLDAAPASLPLVSVIIPAYNAAAFIGRTLRSMVAQTYPNVEILVVDDGSQDRTADIVTGIAQHVSNLRLLQQSNQGVAAARNLGIAHAQGEFIAPIDADDIWYPSAIEKLVAQFQTCSPVVGVVYTWSIDIDEHDRPMGGFHAASIGGDVHKTLMCHNFLGTASATLIRKVCFERVGGYDTQLRANRAQGCEDWDLYLRIAACWSFEAVPEFLVGYRKVSSGMSRDFSQMARSQQLMLEAVQAKHPHIPDFLYRLSRSSFYLYLARECEAAGQARASITWLWHAVKVDPITPVGRLGLYTLLARNLIKKFIEKVARFSSAEALAMVKLTKPSVPAVVDSSQPLAMDAPPNISRLKVYIKVGVGLCLHQLLLRV